MYVLNRPFHSSDNIWHPVYGLCMVSKKVSDNVVSSGITVIELDEADIPKASFEKQIERNRWLIQWIDKDKQLLPVLCNIIKI